METLDRLVSHLREMVTVLGDARPPATPVKECSILEPQDLDHAGATDRSDEVVLLIASGRDELSKGLTILGGSRPAIVMAKSPDAGELRRLAVAAGIPFVARVNGDVPWGQLHGLVERMLSSTSPLDGDAANGTVTRVPPSDLFAIANSLADQIGGYVSIDDPQSRVLAFSPLDKHADQLRRDSILGRAAPPGHREQLRAQGVWDRLNRPGQVMEFPRAGDIMPRLAIGIHDERTERYLGTIWVQQGVKPFAPRAGQILAAGSKLAARAILRGAHVESRESETVLQIIGLRHSPEAPRTLAAILGLTESRTWMVIGFTSSSDAPHEDGIPGSASSTLALHAAVIRDRSQTAIADGSAYVVIPNPPSPNVIISWAERTSQALAAAAKAPAVCAVGPVIDSPRELPAARETVDTMLRGSRARGEVGVTTYDAKRALLLVSRAVQDLWDRGVLTGEPVRQIAGSSHVDGHDLLRTIEVYFDERQSAQRAAAALHLHPNTLRQRLRRIERLTGLSLDSTAERLMLELEVRAHADGLGRDVR
jgi:hypothetical protein